MVRTGAALASMPLLGLTCAARLASEDAARAVLLACCSLMRRTLGVELTIEDENQGRGPPGPYVVVALNQTSLIKAFLLPAVYPGRLGSIINVEFALYPFLGWAFWAAGGIPIVRQWPAQARRGLARAERDLQQGKSIGISIEGRRSRDGQISKFKKGPVVLALRTGAPLLPLVFHGARERLPWGSFFVRPGPVTARLCRAIETRGLGYEHRDALVAQLEEIARRQLSSS
jgi:1-acyl-sn-glycerol-3-phosphate acyltransferase